MLLCFLHRVLKDLRQELKEEQERKIRNKEARQRRQLSAARRAQKSGSVDLEKALVLGLVDICPRCGESLEEFESEEACREHLLLCTNEEKHAVYSNKQKLQRHKEEVKEQKRSAQEEAQTQAAFTFLGAQDSQLWLLNDEQVRRRAIDIGVDANGSKEEIIRRIVGRDNNEGASGQLVVRTSKRKPVKDEDHSLVVRKKTKTISADSIPSNLYGLPVAQLRSICAANGLLSALPPKATKDEIISVIEEAIYT